MPPLIVVYLYHDINHRFKSLFVNLTGELFTYLGQVKRFENNNKNDKLIFLFGDGFGNEY
jgi:hypothetical protein